VIEIVAQSEAMREAVSLAERVAATDANVLVTGESGAGKDALALFVHFRSKRAAQALVKIDCATLPADLLEAELFGYERGAFTGANEAKPGRLEAAHRGPDAYAHELALLWLGPWGFALEELRVPVWIWHGSADASVPLAVAQSLAARIPGARLEVFDGDGHLAVHTHAATILATLVCSYSSAKGWPVSE